MQFILVARDEATTRLDQFLASKLGISRTQAQRMLDSGLIQINRKSVKSKQRVKDGDQVAYSKMVVKESHVKAEKIPLKVIFEDDDLLVVDKPAGMVVHPDSSGHSSGTLVNAIMAHCKNLSGIGGVKRPGIVHRLDKGTSGVLLVAKNDATHQKLAKLFHDHEIKKTYLTLVRGLPKSEKGRIDAPLSRHSTDRKRMAINKQEGRNAVTTFELVASYKGVSLLKVNIETGRTHQIRVHLAGIGHPIVGDETYGDKQLNKLFRTKYGLSRQFLHAESLEYDNEKFVADLPNKLKELLKKL